MDMNVKSQYVLVSGFVDGPTSVNGLSGNMSTEINHLKSCFPSYMQGNPVIILNDEPADVLTVFSKIGYNVISSTFDSRNERIVWTLRKW